MSISPFEHPFLKGHFTQQDIGRYFSAEEDVKAMLAFEGALAKIQAQMGVIPKKSGIAIGKACQNASIDLNKLRSGTEMDGTVVPAFIRQLKESLSKEHQQHIHFGATSQDVIDSSLMIRLSKILPLMRSQLCTLVDQIAALDAEYGSGEIMGRTRMQQALPITVSSRLNNWSSPLIAHLKALDVLQPQLLQIQYGGAVGTLEKLGAQGQVIKQKLAETLGLQHQTACWHTDRHTIVDFTNWLSKLSGSLGKIGQDALLMAQNEIAEIQFRKGGASSTMPHKSNPVQAELLVTLARYNAAQVSAMHQTMIHEQERSGSSWCLEWMILPSMVMTTASGLNTTKSLFENIFKIGNQVR